MKRILKKMLVWLVLLSMIATMFASCNTPDSDNHTHNEPSSEKETSSSTKDDSSSTEESTSNTESHKHDFGAWNVIKEATCTSDGEQERTCSCGEKETQPIKAKGHVILSEGSKVPTCTEQGFTEGQTCSVCQEVLKQPESIPAKGHAWGNGVVTKEPTATETGIRSFVCENCGETKTETIPASTHTHSYIETVTAPTCTERGFTTHTCSCGDTYVDNYVNAKGHTVIIDKAVAPTCTETGLNEGKHCSVCGEILVKQEEVPAAGHAWGNPVVTKEPTEETTGVRTYTCENCGEKKTETIPVLTHTHKYEQTVTKPTCTERGYTTYICKCGDTYVDNYVSAKGHSFGNWSVSKEATCTEKGEETRICKNCNHVETREIEAKGHDYKTVVTAPTCTERGYTTYTCQCGDTYVDNYVNAKGHTIVIDKAVAPTCTETGLNEGKHCSVCGEILVKQEEVPATGHAWGNPVVTKEPTEETTGVRTYTCENCKETRTETIPVLAHTHKYTTTVTKPTCTEKGYTTYTCKCGDTYVDNYVSAKGHSFGNWSVSKEATCTEKGTETRACKNCDHAETREIEAKGHDYKTVVTAPTCTERGYTTYTCQCGDTYVDNYVSAKGHSFGNWSVSKEATCTEKGAETRICKNCSHKETREIEAKGHDYKTVVTAPTCTERGYTTYTCKCGDTYVDQYVNATGHNFSEWYETKAPTESEQGEERRDCANCDYYEKTSIATLAHSHDRWEPIILNAVAPTCTTTGLTEGIKCSGCGETLIAQQIVFELGHDFVNHEAKVPSCTVGWDAYISCSRCDYTTYNEIPAVHQYNSENTCSLCKHYADEGVIFELSKDGLSYVVKDYLGTASKIIIPSEYNGKCVVKIESEAFYGCTQIEEIYVPCSIKTMGARAFAWCTNLVYAEVYGSFSNNSQRNTTDGKEIFRGCSKLETLIVADLEISSNVNDYNRYYPLGYIFGESHYENSVANTMHYMDYFYAELFNATYYLPKSLKTLYIAGYGLHCYTGGAYTYPLGGLNSIDEIIIKDGLTYIASDVFSKCGVKRITIPNSVTSIDSKAFDWFMSLERINFDGTIEQWKAIKKYDNWNINTGNYTVYCTDGTIAKDGKVTCREHAEVIDVTVAPTCTKTGLSEGKHCSVCGEILVKQEEVPATGHAWGNPVVTKEPTEETTGIRTYTCENCKETRTETIPVLAHTHKYTATITKPTCTEKGYTTYTCKCGDTYVDNYVNAKGHSFGNWTVSKEATCTAKGEETRACKNCSQRETREIEAKGHDYKSVVTAPTCTEKGYTTYTCKCGDTYVDKYVNAKGHTVIVDKAVASTCTEAGLSEGKHCSVCGEILVAQEVIPMKDHSYENGKCTFCGVKYVTQDSYFTFTLLDDGTYSIAAKDVNNMPENVVIPATYNGETVTQIASKAFYQCTKLLTVELPESITIIGKQAFSGCENLSTVNISEGVTDIFESAFSSCKKLTHVEFPSTVKTIGASAFWGCESLTDIEIGENVTKIGGLAFAYCKGLTNVKVHKNVNSLGQYVFRGCTALKKAETPLGYDIFYGCSALEEVIIPEGVTKIYQETFYQCNALTTIVIPESLTTIASNVFADCIALRNVYYYGNAYAWTKITKEYGNTVLSAAFIYEYSEEKPTAYGIYWHDVNGVPTVWENTKTPTSNEYFTFTKRSDGTYGIAAKDAENLPEKLIIPYEYEGKPVTLIEGFQNCLTLIGIELPNTINNIGKSAFSGSRNLKDILMPVSLSYIGSYAFKDCLGIVNIELPESVTNINGYAFDGCTGLTRIVIPKNVRSMRGGFRGCTSLTDVTIPDDWIEISYEMFYGCISLVSIDIPESVTKIDIAAFYGCTNLSAIDLPDGLTVIGNAAFEGCSSLKTLNVPKTVKTVDARAFYGCSALEEIALPNSATVNGNRLFSYCSSLKFIDLPDSMTKVGTYMFYKCTNLVSVTMHIDITEIGEYAFSDCVSLASIELPEGLISVGNSAFSGCKSLTEITIPSSLKKLSPSMMSGCTNLKNVVLQEGLTEIGNYTFSGCTNLTSIELPKSVTVIDQEMVSSSMAVVYYKGSAEDWHQVSIHASNQGLHNAAVHFYSESKPMADGDYWHYVDGKPTAWEHRHSDGLAYTFDAQTKTYSVSKGICTDADIIIPSTHNGYPVTQISKQGFLYLEKLISIEIPESITVIGNSAFNSCEELTAVSLGKKTNLTEIGEDAFARCYKLKYVYYGGSIEDFSAVMLGSSNEYLIKAVHYYSENEPAAPGAYWCFAEGIPMVWEEYAYSYLTFTLLADGTYSVKPNDVNNIPAHVVIPATYNGKAVTTIDSHAFYNCKALASILIPDGITIIPPYAFAGCEKLVSVKLPDGLKTIDNYAFYNCKKLKDLILPESVTTIEGYAFLDCSALNSVLFPKTVYMGYRAFYGCTNLSVLYYAGKPEDFANNVTYYGQTWDHSAILEAERYYYSENEPVLLGKWWHYVDGVPNYWGEAYDSALEFVLNETSYHVTIGNYQGTEVTVPSQYNGLPVTKVDFSSCKQLTSVKIPKGVKTIKLKECTSLVSVELPEDIEQINASMFYGCTSLTSIVIPKGVTVIDSSAFEGCTGLTSIVIPEGVTVIGSRAFEGCTSLTSIVIPKSLNNINDSTFNLCSALKTVYYMGTATEWDEITIVNYYNTWLTGATRLYYRENEPNDTGLYWHYVDGVQTVWDEYTYSYLTFKLNSDGTYYVANVKDMVNLPVNLVIPATYNGKAVTAIGSNAFLNCITLESVEIPKGITTINSYAFNGCTSLTSIEIPNGVTKIDQGVFNNCKGLTNIVLPDGVTSIGYSAFYGCISLTSIEIPNSVTKIDGYVFNGCKGLTSVVLPVGLTTIPINAFSGCSELTSIKLPDGVTSIGGSAFAGCTSLTSIEIPCSVTSIDSYAFYNCYALKKVYYGGTKEEWSAITIGSDNYYLSSPYYYSENEPTTNGNWWHYVDGVPTVWDVHIHTEVVDVAKAPTCTETGLTEGKHCSVCGVTLVKQEEIPAQHNYINGICSACGKKESTPDSYFVFTLLDDGTYSIRAKDVNNMPANIIIPSEYNGKAVTYIDEYAFGGCNSLVNVTIPEGIIIIDECAFEHCDNLKDVTIADSVTTIGRDVFQGCGNLTYNYYGNAYYLGNSSKPYLILMKAVSQNITYVNIHSQTVIVYNGAFAGCNQLTKVNITDLAAWSKINFAYESEYEDGCTDFYCSSNPLIYAHDLYLNGTKLKSLQIPNGVTKIGNFAFCEGSFTSVSIPSSVQSIGVGAFRKISVESLVLPEGLTTIGADAFAYCAATKSVTIPTTLKSVGESAFYGCSGLEAVYISDLAAWCGIGFSVQSDWDEGYWQDSHANPLRYAHKLYLNGDLITDLVIPNGVTYLGAYAFHGGHFNTISIPDGITSIPSGAFRNCSMKAIYIPDSVKTIGYYAFTSCSNLDVLVMNNVTKVYDWALWGCSSLKAIYSINSPGISTDPDDGNSGYRSIVVTGYHCVNIDGVIYGIKNGVATLLFVPDYVSEIDILPTIEYDSVTYTVTSIGEKAFYECSDLVRVKIPDSVTNIGNYAFAGCTRLTDIIIPDSVISINTGAFQNCAGLTNVVIGNGVNTIESYAFCNCTGLTSITIPETVTTISSAAFQSCYKLVEVINQSALPITAGSSDHGCVAYYAAEVHSGPTKIDNQDGYLFYVDGEKNYLLGYSGEETQLILPSNYKSQGYEICEYAFAYNNAIVSVVIPNGVTSINAYTFKNCENLIVVKISDSVVSLGTSAFYGCTNLKDITIGNNVTSIGDSTFSSCRSLTNIVIPNSVTRIGNYAFEYCTSLKHIVIPDSVTYLGYYAFSDCTAMTSAVIGNNVPELSSYVFGDCSSLKSVTIGTGVKTINPFAFSGCSGLNAVCISDIAAWCEISLSDSIGGVSTPLIIAKNLYLNGTLVTNLVIPEGVTKIGSKAFMGCTSLIDITIPNSVKTIGNDAFRGCTSLKNVVIPNSVEYISWRAFQNCTSLESVTLGNSLNYIYGNAFQGCSALTSIVIPASVETIGPNAFSNCTSLTSVTFETTNRWLISSSSSTNSGGTILSSTNFSDPTKAAEYLTSTYVGEYWHIYTR